MEKQIYVESQADKSALLWTRIKGCWQPGVSVTNPEAVDLLGPVVKVNVVLCPLYSPGSLTESKLMEYPSIEGSRVANKINAYKTVLKTMAGNVSAIGQGMFLEIVFANKGVLFPVEPK
ncbi:MAG: hypothetical protein ACD_19C00426G0023 [uncultured bacterium]|nr:MAG: hypothetical protein ACD_19C00426G0023 [uncultured bacterium]